MEISKLIKDKAPIVLEEIKRAESILLCCHPSPDPDSVGSNLAMKFALERMGKRVTLLKGDSEIPQAFMHFPGAEEIIEKNFFEADLSEFDIFMAIDAGSVEMVSRRGDMAFPENLLVINIDHHKSNNDYGKINLIESSYPASAQILFDLFHEWNVEIDEKIASNLYLGLYSDTMFKYPGTTAKTFEVAAQLVGRIKNMPELVSEMENCNTPHAIKFQGLALSSIETFLDGKCAVSSVSYEDISKNGIAVSEIGTSDTSTIMRGVIGWDIDVALIEPAPMKTKASFRTRDFNKYDVSKLAVALGGGGHMAASGAVINLPIQKAKKLVVDKVKEIYNL